MRSLTPDQRLEITQWDQFWVPPGTQVVERPELAYRAHPENEPHLNTVVRTRVPRVQLRAAVAEVTRQHQGRTSRWVVPPTVDTAALTQALTAAGYHQDDEAQGCLVPVDAFVPRAGATLTVKQVVDAEGQAQALAIMDEVFGMATAPTPEARAHQLSLCTGPHARMLLYVAQAPDGTPVATAGLTLYPALGMGYLFGGATREAYRGQGAYASLLATRVYEARRRNLDSVGLYANLRTSLPVVKRMGFTPLGRVSYWQR